MKTSRLLAAACAATFVGGAASADIMIPGPHTLGAGEEVVYDLTVTTGGTAFFGFDVAEPTPDGSWASDVAISIDGTHVIGGFNDPAPGGSTLGAWDFDGAASDLDGTYLEGTNGLALAAGTYTFTFRNAWAADPNANDYSNIRINGVDGSASIVPEPGSFALLGLGGLALLRRRR